MFSAQAQYILRTDGLEAFDALPQLLIQESPHEAKASQGVVTWRWSGSSFRGVPSGSFVERLFENIHSTCSCLLSIVERKRKRELCRVPRVFRPTIRKINKHGLNRERSSLPRVHSESVCLPREYLKNHQPFRPPGQSPEPVIVCILAFIELAFKKRERISGYDVAIRFLSEPSGQMVGLTWHSLRTRRPPKPKGQLARSTSTRAPSSTSLRPTIPMSAVPINWQPVEDIVVAQLNNKSAGKSPWHGLSTNGFQQEPRCRHRQQRDCLHF